MAAAHILVASIPATSAKMPYFLLNLDSNCDEFAISEALEPYARNRAGYRGSRDSNRVPNLRAMRLKAPGCLDTT